MKNNNNIECPKCLSTGEVMEARKESKGFQYARCTLCNATGTISDVLEEDYLLSLNEDLLETNDDW